MLTLAGALEGGCSTSSCEICGFLVFGVYVEICVVYLGSVGCPVTEFRIWSFTKRRLDPHFSSLSKTQAEEKSRSARMQ